jgi:hypothetical protein
MDKAGSAREGVAVEGSGRAPMGIERVRGEDTLTVIRRWECPNDAEHVIRTAAAPEGVERWRCYGCRVDAVEVEYVPRTDDRGAVEALRDIAKVDAIDAALDPQRPLRIAKAWLREHPERGGQ